MFSNFQVVAESRWEQFDLGGPYIALHSYVNCNLTFYYMIMFNHLVQFSIFLIEYVLAYPAAWRVTDSCISLIISRLGL